MRKPRESVVFVVCVAYPGEWEPLRDLAIRQWPECYPVQAVPTARLGEECEVRLGFFVGDGLAKGPNGESLRRPKFTDPVKAADHWTPGASGAIVGTLRVASFCGALSKLLPDTNATLRHYGDELSVTYG